MTSLSIWAASPLIGKPPREVTVGGEATRPALWMLSEVEITAESCPYRARLRRSRLHGCFDEACSPTTGSSWSVFSIFGRRSINRFHCLSDADRSVIASQADPLRS
jgi:hypothetical protein